MRLRSHGLIGGVLAVLLAIVPLLGTAAGRAAQIDGATYTSPQYGYVVEWDAQWGANPRNVTSEEGGQDDILLTNNDGRIRIVGQGGGVAAEAFLEEIAATFTRDDAAISTIDTNDQGVVTAEVTTARNHVLLEAHTLGDAVVVVALSAREADYPTALAAAQTGVTLNGTPILTGEAAGNAGAGNPTEEATETPTEGATEQATAQATGEPTTEGTPVPGESGFDGDVYTSPAFGYSLDVPADWTVDGESQEANAETLVLTNGTSTITLHATSDYDGDLPGCVDYARGLAEDDPAYPDLDLELTANGDPFQGADDRSAYALLSYTGEDGELWAHFIHCQAIEEGASVLILTQDVPFDDYAAERGARRQIQNAIDLP